MRKTSTKVQPRRSRRGFTMIELSVVIVIIIVTSALLAPNIISMGEGIQARNFLGSLPQLASQAREAAISNAATTKLTYDDAQKTVIVSRETDGEDDTTIATASVPKGVQVEDFQLNGESSNAGDWEVRFYSDGQCDSGGLEVTDERRPWSLVIDKYGIAKLQEGTLPSESQTRWPAGDYEHRQ